MANIDPLDLPLEGAGQSCKECRRRKAKCSRAIPICGACLKYGRHCLYEKYSRTPLTRKHLTEVEERLERAERLLRQARLKPHPPSNVEYAQPKISRLSLLSPLNTEGSPDALNSVTNVQEQEFDFNAFSRGPQPLADVDSFTTVPSRDEFQSRGPFDQDGYFIDDGETIFGAQSRLAVTEDDSHPSNTLDGPPIVSENFEWDEQHLSAADGTDLGQSSLGYIASEGDGEPSTVTDGMASLTMSEAESGYFGAASGAALLRIIDTSTTGHLAQQDNVLRSRFARMSSSSRTRPVLLYEQPNPNRHIADTMIDAYFKHYNMSYPVVHEPTFRAQYTEVIERPNGDCWKVLAYVVAAIGVFATATNADTSYLPLFAQAKSLLQWSYLESGNLTLIQVLVLMSNYLQKTNKPNSGYNYLGLASRMAMGMGLHKEFPGWKIQPLKMEIRRRVWWCLAVFDIGATITFGRPIAWPGGGIDIALPLNVDDRELTMASRQYPPPSQDITAYTALRTYAAFYLATNRIYSRIISKPFPSAKELIDLDNQTIGGWYSSLPSYFTENALVGPKYCTPHKIMMWKYRNFKIIMYRPYVIKQALCARQGYSDNSPEAFQAYDRCLHEAKSTILSIQEFWNSQEHTRIGAWYALYFLFQAALIPCICLRNEPASANASEWRHQIQSTLHVIESISSFNPSGKRCIEVISGLCDPYLSENASTSALLDSLEPINESPQTQLNNVHSMIWPNSLALEADVVMQGAAWMDFICGEN